ncbi:hypothetical protein CDAR_459001 [Caerostris darwini]|uniref:Uncharacterized protein n=1 Tax=Caerostris darwini TaxID=1538125 RepID=A0AAV4SST6_9ARAC|nr:hypothetical protein CDAR_459001 [Caerostris darwini]
MFYCHVFVLFLYLSCFLYFLYSFLYFFNKWAFGLILRGKAAAAVNRLITVLGVWAGSLTFRVGVAFAAPIVSYVCLRAGRLFFMTYPTGGSGNGDAGECSRVFVSSATRVFFFTCVVV